MSQGGDKVFAGSIPQLYDEYLVPLIFEPYAEDLAARVAARDPASVLEIAAGTGVVTRAMAKRLPAATSIVATDLNAPMIERAQAIGTSRPVEWRTADAMSLPFGEASFDAVVCQFGAMFFPDKAKAFAEARRVLRPGGAFLFNVWDRIEDNEFADVATQALAEIFPADPPLFMARTPHGYFDKKRILDDLAKGGFTQGASIDTVTHRSRADSARRAAVAYCQGTPLRNEIESRESGSLARATEHAERALARRFGSRAVDGRIQAHVVGAPRD
jgi:SAM-dependent methyltransferase